MSRYSQKNAGLPQVDIKGGVWTVVVKNVNSGRVLFRSAPLSCEIEAEGYREALTESQKRARIARNQPTSY